MLPLSPLLLLVFPAALLVAAHGAGDLHGFTFHGGSAGFDPTGITQGRLNHKADNSSHTCLTKSLHCIQITRIHQLLWAGSCLHIGTAENDRILISKYIFS